KSSRRKSSRGPFTGAPLEIPRRITATARAQRPAYSTFWRSRARLQLLPPLRRHHLGEASPSPIETSDMSEFPKNLRYSKEHEWARLESDGSVVVGITTHAVEALGDITMVTLPEVGDTLAAGETFGDIDSVKAVSELYA